MSEQAKTNPSQPRKLRDVQQWDRETDIAIVGFGGAGGAGAFALPSISRPSMLLKNA